MKGILVVRLYMNAHRFRRKLQKLVSRINEAAPGTDVMLTDFETLPKSDPETVNDNHSGVILSGTEALYTRTADRIRFNDFIKSLPKIRVPILGICGGHQALALAYGGKVTKMHDPVEGFRTVILEDKDTLLAGLPSKIRVLQSHREEVKPLPSGFLCIARSAGTEIEGMRHEKFPIYGLQFHPEGWNEENPAGKRILENFLQRIASTA